jgi:hypothetical protein
MLARLRIRRPSHTTIVAYLALFIAVGGGTAFAVVAANQVNSESIIDRQVQNQDIADASVGPFKIKEGGVGFSNLQPNSVESSKVINGTLSGDDIAPNAITALNVKDRSLDPADYKAVYGFSGRINGLAASGTQYAAVSGTSTATSDAVQTQISPNPVPAWVLPGHFIVHQRHKVAAGSYRIYSVFVDGNIYGGCAVVAGQTDCEQGTGYPTVPPHSRWQIQTTTTGTPGATVAAFGLRLREFE